jgi:hypothetical protein
LVKRVNAAKSVNVVKLDLKVKRVTKETEEKSDQWVRKVNVVKLDYKDL